MQFQLNMQNTQKSNLDNSQCRPGKAKKKKKDGSNNAQILKYLYNQRDPGGDGERGEGVWQRESGAKLQQQKFVINNLHICFGNGKNSLFQASLLHLARISHCSSSRRIPTCNTQ